MPTTSTSTLPPVALTPHVRIAPTAIRIRLRMIPIGSLFPEPTQRKLPKQTPDAPERVRPMLGAVQPKSERAWRVDVRRRVEQVFAGRPVAVAAIGVAASDPFEEGAAVGRVVAEVALLRHRLGVLVRSRRQRGRETKRAQAVPPARQVDLTEQLRLECGEMHARR